MHTLYVIMKLTLEGGRKYTAMWLGVLLGLVVLGAEIALDKSVSAHAEMYLLYFGAMVSVFAGANAFVERGYAAHTKPTQE